MSLLKLIVVPGQGGAILEASSVVSEDMPMNLSARCVASELIRGDDSFTDGVEVGGVAVTDGSSGARHVDRYDQIATVDQQDKGEQPGRGGRKRNSLRGKHIQAITFHLLKLWSLTIYAY